MEEIIIDGVDVTGCEHRFDDNLCALIDQYFCEDSDCYYKQLKRLEQENAELKAENERLKTQYNCYACGNCKGKEDYINLEKHHKGLRKQFDKKVQTLQEIKAVAKTGMHCEGMGCDFMPKILDLITKAEEE